LRSAADKPIFTADLAGTCVFAIEGALAAILGGLDLMGVMALAFATALGGGIIRDLLIGAAPPQAIRDWRYAAIAFVAGGVTFAFTAAVQRIPAPVLIGLDAAGLALFAVAGTEKALAYGIQPLIAVLMGMITGVGGGTVRDILLARIPAVLRVDIYATAALAGAAVIVLGRHLRWPVRETAIAGGAVCFLLRVVSVWQHWQLPTAGGPHP